MKQSNPNILKKMLTVLSWVLCAFFCLCVFSDGIITKLCMVACAVLVCPLFRSKVPIAKKIWIPAVVVLFCVGGWAAPAPTDTPDPSGLTSSQISSELVPEEIILSSSVQPESQATPEASSAVSQESEALPEASSTILPESETSPEASSAAAPESQEPTKSSSESETTQSTDTGDKSEQTTTEGNTGSSSGSGTSSGSGSTGTAGISSGGSTGSSSGSSTSSGSGNSGTSGSSQSDTIVYITDTGACYHRSTCRTLKKSKIETTLSAAKAAGYKPCGICDPPT